MIIYKFFRTRGLFCGAALIMTTLGGQAAFASPLSFFYSTSYGNSSWTLDSNPTPISFDANSFSVAVQNPVGPDSRPISTFYTSQEGGAFNDPYGPQIFAGTTAAPSFSPGVFTGFIGGGTLTISGGGPSAPAPQIGFGWLSALAAALVLVITRALPLSRKVAQG
jgi:hypothetical protein